MVRTGPEPEPDRGEPFAMVRFEVQAARQNQTTVRFWVHLLLFKNRTEPDHGSTTLTSYHHSDFYLLRVYIVTQV